MAKEGLRYGVIGGLWLMLCPLLALPYIVWGIWHQRRGAFALFSLWLGIMAYISFPSEDLYRHYFLYTFFEVRPISAVTWIDISLNGVLPYVYWVMSHAGIAYAWLRLMEVTVGFYLLTIVYRWMTAQAQSEYTKDEQFARASLVFLFFDFLYTVMGVKYGFALCLYVFALHLLMNLGKRKWGIVVLVITCCWHSSFIFTAPLVWALYRLKLSRKKALWICVMLAVVAPIVIYTIGEAILGRRFDFYFSKKAGDVISYGAMTPIGLTLFILPKLAVLPLVFVLMKHYTTEHRWCRMALGWLILSVALMSNAVTLYRFWWAMMAVGVMALYEIERTQRLSEKSIRLLVLAGVCFTCLNCLTYHKEVIYSPYYKALYPAPLTLSQDYQKQEVYYKIKHDGSFR
jgi:hypothetical protein